MLVSSGADLHTVFRVRLALQITRTDQTQIAGARCTQVGSMRSEPHSKEDMSGCRRYFLGRLVLQLMSIQSVGPWFERHRCILVLGEQHVATGIPWQSAC